MRRLLQCANLNDEGLKNEDCLRGVGRGLPLRVARPSAPWRRTWGRGGAGDSPVLERHLVAALCCGCVSGELLRIRNQCLLRLPVSTRPVKNDGLATGVQQPIGLQLLQHAAGHFPRTAHQAGDFLPRDA